MHVEGKFKDYTEELLQALVQQVMRTKDMRWAESWILLLVCILLADRKLKGF